MLLSAISMKTVNDSKWSKREQSCSWVDPNANRKRICGQEGIRNYCKELLISSVNDDSWNRGGYLQTPFIFPQCSTQRLYHNAKAAVIIGAPTWTSFDWYFDSKKKKSAKIERAGVACKAKSIRSGMWKRMGFSVGLAEFGAGRRMSWGNSITSGQ